MAAKTIISLEDFVKIPEDEVHHELDRGELVILPPPRAGHGRVQSKLLRLLADFLETNSLGEVFPRVGFLLDVDAGTVRAPDVAFVRSSRLAGIDYAEYISSAPDLAIEIVDESDGAIQLMRKVDQYLRSGGHTVWIIYPSLQQVSVYETGGVRILHAGEKLDAPELLPGFAITLEELFQ